MGELVSRPASCEGATGRSTLSREEPAGSTASVGCPAIRSPRGRNASPDMFPPDMFSDLRLMLSAFWVASSCANGISGYGRRPDTRNQDWFCDPVSGHVGR